MCARRVLRAGPAVEIVRSGRARPAGEVDLFADPMPERVEPCLALLSARPPAGPGWAFEVKWDGYRLAVHKRLDAVRIITRGGHDWTHRFPAIEAAARAMPAASFILDGEAVVLDARGASDFGALQAALGGRGGRREAGAAMLYAFDLLYLNGHDLQRMPQDDRRRILEGELDAGAGGAGIRLSEEVEGDPAAFLAQACRLGLEGIIAKRRDAPYRSGRGGDWLKIKCIQTETFLILGYEPSPAALGGMGGLLLAAQGNYGLAYVGSVGTGFTQATATALRQRLDRIKADKPAAKMTRKGVVWVRPTLAAEIAFRGWTGDGKLRHASYKGLRETADEAALFRLP